MGLHVAPVQQANLRVGRSNRSGVAKTWKRARVWFIGAVSKAVGPQGHRGSNPLASAKLLPDSSVGSEREFPKLEVAGSSPVRAANHPAVAQLDQSAGLRNRRSHVRVVPAGPGFRILRYADAHAVITAVPFLRRRPGNVRFMSRARPFSRVRINKAEGSYVTGDVAERLKALSC